MKQFVKEFREKFGFQLLPKNGHLKMPSRHQAGLESIQREMLDAVRVKLNARNPKLRYADFGRSFMSEEQAKSFHRINGGEIQAALAGLQSRSSRHTDIIMGIPIPDGNRLFFRVLLLTEKDGTLRAFQPKR